MAGATAGHQELIFNIQTAPIGLTSHEDKYGQRVRTNGWPAAGHQEVVFNILTALIGLTSHEEKYGWRLQLTEEEEVMTEGQDSSGSLGADTFTAVMGLTSHEKKSG